MNQSWYDDRDEEGRYEQRRKGFSHTHLTTRGEIVMAILLCFILLAFMALAGRVEQ